MRRPSRLHGFLAALIVRVTRTKGSGTNQTTSYRTEGPSMYWGKDLLVSGAILAEPGIRFAFLTSLRSSRKSRLYFREVPRED
jgi:hypothetical protein